MDSMQVISKDNGLIFKYSGDLTLEIIEDIKNEVQSIIDEKSKEKDAIIFDLSEIQFIDSSGIGFLVHMNNRFGSTNRKFYLLRPSDVVKKTLLLVNLLNFFKIIESEDEIFLDT